MIGTGVQNITHWLLVLLVGCLAGASATDHLADYYLYTSSNPDQAQRLFLSNPSTLSSSLYNSQWPTKIIIHGWMKSYKLIPNVEVRSAYLSRGNYNLISMDWSHIAALGYIRVRASIPAVGAHCADFVRFLVAKGGLNLTNLVIIGHSMGAHVAGFCGKKLQADSDGADQLGAIVALDPAFPLFSYVDPTNRLSSSDANYVVSVHTNGLLKGELFPIGDAAYYPNGGQIQPGCGLDFEGTCSHARSVFLYAEAVERVYKFSPYGQCLNSLEFLSTRGHCQHRNKLAELGDPLEVPHVEGVYTFVTNGESPYGHM